MKIERSRKPEGSPAEAKNPYLKSNSMSMSIKMLLCLAIFTFILVAVIWVVQVLMSDTLYANAKAREIELTSEKLRELITADSDKVSETVSDIAEKYNICIKLYSVDNGSFTEEESAIVLINSIVANVKQENIEFFYKQAKKNGGVYKTSLALGTFDSFKPDQSPIESEPSEKDELAIVSLYVEIINSEKSGEKLLLMNSIVTPLETAKRTVREQFTCIIIFLFIGALSVAMVLSRLISNPLKSMNESAKQLASGNYDVNFESCGYREVNELSETLNYAAKELSKNDNLQKELIANISHDLRTPLTMIKGYSEMMRDIPGENTPENIQAIIEETERLSELVNDLLDLSKIESGAKEFTPAPFDLTEAVFSVISRYDKMKTSQGYNIDFSYENNVIVSADRTMILQVIYNLINNAVNYCGDDLYIGVRQDIRIDNNGNRFVRISVRDNGEGIPEDKLPLIWDRYYKVDSVHRRATVGTGIGLSIVKKILIKHNASYGVESTIGVGSVFWFELPVAKE